MMVIELQYNYKLKTKRHDVVSEATDTDGKDIEQIISRILSLPKELADEGLRHYCQVKIEHQYIIAVSTEFEVYWPYGDSRPEHQCFDYDLLRRCQPIYKKVYEHFYRNNIFIVNLDTRFYTEMLRSGAMSPGCISPGSPLAMACEHVTRIIILDSSAYLNTHREEKFWYTAIKFLRLFKNLERVVLDTRSAVVTQTSLEEDARLWALTWPNHGQILDDPIYWDPEFTGVSEDMVSRLKKAGIQLITPQKDRLQHNGPGFYFLKRSVDVDWLPFQNHLDALEYALDILEASG